MQKSAKFYKRVQVSLHSFLGRWQNGYCGLTVKSSPTSGCKFKSYSSQNIYKLFFQKKKKLKKKWNDIRLQCFRLVGAGLATISLGELEWVLGTVFAG